ncbi:MAG TPA: tetratricopeptide repeat protein [Bryobacteraceae bacterium]|nr:tetratricopeptide repeat protein [Bryobacteraceae bacterium]
MSIRAALFFAVLLLPFGSWCQTSGSASDEANTCDPRATFRTVRDLLRNAKNDAAATKLSGLRKCQNLSPIETFEMGWLFGRSRHFATALEIFDKLPPDVPDRKTHGYAVALSQFELADYQAAIKVLENEESAGVADARSTNLLAVSYSKLGLYKNAYAVLSAAIQKDPNDLNTYLNLATVCAEGGDYTKSAEVASQATQRFPQAAEAFIFSGAANSLLGKLDHASTDFKEAARLAPDRPDARFLLAVTQYKQGDVADALTTLKTANKDGLVDSDLHYLTAECLLKLDATKTEPALAEVNRAIALNARSASARTLRGKLLLEAGRTKEAIPDLELAARIDPDSRSAIYNLARAYRSLGKTAEAQALFAKLRTANTDAVAEAGDRRVNEALHGQDVQP